MHCIVLCHHLLNPRSTSDTGFGLGWSWRLTGKYIRNVHDPLNLHSFHIPQQSPPHARPQPIHVPPRPINRDVHWVPTCLCPTGLTLAFFPASRSGINLTLPQFEDEVKTLKLKVMRRRSAPRGNGAWLKNT